MPFGKHSPLTNIARHAAAQTVCVDIQRIGDLLRVQVADDGRGFDVEAVLNREDRGLGLLGMQERIGLVGGDFEIESRLGKGTRVHVKLIVNEVLRPVS